MEDRPSSEAQTIENIFRFSEDVLTDWDTEVSQAWDHLSSLAVAVAEESSRWDDILPYHINLLDNAIEGCIIARYGQVWSPWWFTRMLPSDDYALNFRTFESPGFNALKDENKREVFMVGLADEIHAYIQDFLHFAKERGL